jgi:hypothetical protein
MGMHSHEDLVSCAVILYNVYELLNTHMTYRTFAKRVSAFRGLTDEMIRYLLDLGKRLPTSALEEAITKLQSIDDAIVAEQEKLVKKYENGIAAIDRLEKVFMPAIEKGISALKL